jgi:hypothetical protein
MQYINNKNHGGHFLSLRGVKRRGNPVPMGDILPLYSRTYAWRKVKCVPLSTQFFLNKLKKIKLFSYFSNYFNNYCHTVVVTL